MTMKLDAAAFLEASTHAPVIDVRSPGEFEKGHIPGAVSLPLFSDEERSEVGTIYRKSGRQAALFRGLDIEGPKMSEQLKKAMAVARNGRLLVHCWRGGMRSESMAWLFRQGGLEVNTLEGGYRAYRRYIRDYFNLDLPVVVLGGFSGSGKTAVLKQLRKQQEQVIDLEGLAHHKGSAFGDAGQPPQPSSEQFGNNLAAEWMKTDAQCPLWLEDESRSIGTVSLPAPVFLKISRAPLIFVELPLEERIRRIVREYSGFPEQQLSKAILQISKRLGGQNTKEALRNLSLGNYEDVVRIVLRYYDKTYRNGLTKREGKQVFRLKLTEDDPIVNAHNVLSLYATNIS